VDVHFAETYITNGPHQMPNHWMGRYGLTNNMAEQVDQDQDGDGLSAWQEYVMDTDPTDRDSLLRLDVTHGQEGGMAVRSNSMDAELFLLTWQGSADRKYTVYCSTNLAEGFTSAILENYRPAESGPVTFSDESSDSAGTRYYRIKACLP